MSNIDAFILGGSQTDFMKQYSDSKDGIDRLFKEITEKTLQEAKLDYKEIERLKKENRIEIFVGNFASELFIKQGHLGPFLTEVHPSFIGIPAARYEAACASATLATHVARSRIRANEIDLGIVVGIEIMRNVPPSKANDYIGACSHYASEGANMRFFYPNTFGLLTDAYLEKYSHVAEDRLLSCFDVISQKNRNNSTKNPLAQIRNDNHDKKHLAVLDRKYKTIFGGRTRFSDCSQVSDGAASLLVASPSYTEKYLKEKNKNKSDVARIAGAGFRVSELKFKDKIDAAKDNSYILPWGRQTVVDAFDEAKVTIDNIDCIELHDCFTINELITTGNFGIAKPGEEYTAIEEGWTQRDGKIPVNPSGGLIGAGHPVGASGGRMILDIFRQVTDNAGDYQVENAKRGATFNVGGNCTTTMSMVIENAEAS